MGLSRFLSLLLLSSCISLSCAISHLVDGKDILRPSSSISDATQPYATTISGTFAVFGRSVGGTAHSNSFTTLNHFDLATGKLISNVSLPFTLSNDDWMFATFVSSENSPYGKPIFYIDSNLTTLITLDATSGSILNSVPFNPTALLFSNGLVWAPKSQRLIGLATYKVI